MTSRLKFPRGIAVAALPWIPGGGGVLGVSFLNQARYLTQAYGIAKKNPRIDMFLWFLLRDERLGVDEGWQSGLLTATGAKKPAFAAFQKLRG